MAFIENITTRNKLLLGFGIVIALMLAISATAYFGIRSLQSNQRHLIQDDLANTLDLLTVRNLVNRERANLYGLAVGANAEHTKILSADNEAIEQQLATVLRRLSQRASSQSLVFDKADVGTHDRLSTSLANITETHRIYEEIKQREVLPALAAGRLSEATEAITGPLRAQYMRIRQIADTAGERQEVQTEARIKDSQEQTARLLAVVVAGSLTALLAACLLALGLARIISRPLTEATRVAERLAAGDLTVAVPESTRRDEVGSLLQALHAMVGTLKGMLGETSSGVATLAAASSEILAITSQMVGGASETASAVNETTATVEEVKQTAHLAAQKARAVSDSAQGAAGAAEEGRRSVDEALGELDRVQDQIESIAETVIRLSEQSQAIGEIIATVSGLAEQSNLLAVNASIEAAKAGEHGKGFAVVAQEIKELADQSKQATRQVRTILSDIQKAVSSAVLTTEQGSRTAETSAQRAGAVGESIRLLAASIAEAAQAATQIAVSSQQQLAGMDQVAQAMSNIKQASAENVAGSRQSEASAKNLHELGLKLQQMVERFRL